MFLNCRRRRHIIRIVTLMIVACLLVLCFQLFLFGAISGYHDERGSSGWFDRGARPKYIEDETHLQRVVQRNSADIKANALRTTKGCDEKNCSESGRTRIVKNHQNQVMEMTTTNDMPHAVINQSSNALQSVNTSSFTSIWQYLELKFPLDGEEFVTGASILGANHRWKRAYVSDADGFFTCFSSQEKIPFSQVNDDFCDCSDHSDEPGTSACVSGRFYCTFQPSTLSSNPKWLPSSRVNDGLCDCCDGSDEWANHTLPSHILLSDKNVAHYNIYQAPCGDRCDEFRLLEAQLAELRKQGLALKDDYLKAGLGQSNPNNLYGPNAIFYKLSTMCLDDVHFGKYTYSVCPFGPVKQKESGLSVLIGQSPQWLERGPAAYRLLLSDGDSMNCPGSATRRTTVIFECGINDHVISLSENEVCQYLVRFSSPAAC